MLLALGLGAGGLALVWTAHRYDRRREDIPRWPTVEGRLLEVQLFPPVTPRDSYKRWAHYVYRVEGVEHTGTFLFGAVPPAADSYLAQRAGVAPLLGSLGAELTETPTPGGMTLIYRPVRQVVKVSYNPAEPADAVLILAPESRRENFMAGAGWTLGVIALGLFFFAVTTGRSRPTPSDPAPPMAPAPTAADLEEFNRLLDGASNAAEAEARMQSNPAFWLRAAETLRSVRAQSETALRQWPALGLNRGLDELGLGVDSLAEQRTRTVIGAAEEFHRAWRARQNSGDRSTACRSSALYFAPEV